MVCFTIQVILCSFPRGGMSGALNLVPDPTVNPNFQFVSVTTNSARSYYDALQLKFQRRLSRGLQSLASYTFSHSIDNTSTDAVANYLNTPGGGSYQSVDRGDSDFDIRHSFTAGVTYDLPSPGAQRVVRTILGSWSLDTLVIARSAPPDDVVGAIYFAAGTALYPRPNINPGMPFVLYGSQNPGGKIFNKAAFTAPPKGQQGYARVCSNTVFNFVKWQGE